MENTRFGARTLKFNQEIRLSSELLKKPACFSIIKTFILRFTNMAMSTLQ